MNKKTAATIIITTLILVAIPVTLYLSQRPQPMVTKAEAETELSISSADVVLDETFDLNVNIDSGNNLIFGADLEITFDPAILEAQSITAGDFLAESFSIGDTIIDNETGKVVHALGSWSTENTGQGTLAVITFRAQSGGSSDVSFGSGTSVVASGESEALSSTTDGVVNVAVAGSLGFKVKFQGIDQQLADRTVKVTLVQAGPTVNTFDNIAVTADANGIYSGNLPNIPFGTYDILIKGWVHLTKALGSISLTELENSFDWSGMELLAGDAFSDDKVNIQDYGVLASQYRCPDAGTDCPAELTADFDLNGKVNIQDFRFIAENYRGEGDSLPTE